MSKKRNVRDILGPDKEDELLQSFVRVGLKADDEEDNNEKLTINQENSRRKSKQKNNQYDNYKQKLIQQQKQQHQQQQQRRDNKTEKINSETLKKRKPKESFNEFYTDKDRAAAVSAGSYDIKQSLKLKWKQDRSETLLITDETDPNALMALALKDMKRRNVENAIQNISRALELNKNDVNALVSRSKCYLLLGEPGKALQDAETALNLEKNNIRAIYQKAESLYYLGQFEQSLMFFHRGHKARPELSTFKLGIQKTQEAIENTIGTAPKPALKNSTKCKNPITDSAKLSVPLMSNPKRNKIKLSKNEREKRNTRKLLGELCVDKEYLEKLLQHPDLKKADTNTENVSLHAKEAVEFLKKRQEFWRQQRPCTALPNYKNLPEKLLSIAF